MAKISLRAYNREIESMMDRGHLDEAVAHCHHILKKFPKHLETYRLLGKLYLELKRPADAADIFSRALTAEPNDFVSHVGMSIIRDEENKLDDAIWHMERAFETQPSNAAIQGELQRLYGRRDGVQPPRIRMTRGALAHMYVRGELYPQAISEIKGILAEDPGRSDMQALLGLAYYRNGRKNDAADASSALLKRYPYCLDANRVMVEALGSDRPEAQAYRQRVVELDPYAALVDETVFKPEAVSDAAVTLERFDWNGQPTGMGPDWSSTQAIGLESGEARGGEPGWLKGSFAETAAPPPSESESVPAFTDSAATPALTAAESAEDIPDFMRKVGWGPSTGAVDESKLVFSDEPESQTAEQPIEKGVIPDWLQAMAPAEAVQPPQQEEEMPDWISKIGTEEFPVPSVGTLSDDSQLDWLNQVGETPAIQAPPFEDQPAVSPVTDETPDWLKGLGEEIEPTPAAEVTGQPEWGGSVEEQPAIASVSDETPDWLKGLGEEIEPTPAAEVVGQPEWMGSVEDQPFVASVSDETPDWLKNLGEETEPTPAEAPTDLPDWLRQFGTESEPTLASSTQLSNELDFLAPLSEETESVSAESFSREFDFLSESPIEPEQPVVPVVPLPAMTDTGELGKSEQERDDSFAWLEALAAKQGATEGLLTKPEERSEKEPEWVEQVKRTTGQLIEQKPSELAPPQIEEPAFAGLESVLPPVASMEELGKSDQERDDSFAWLEALAAKQGASEGLLTKPEERLQEEPEWVKQAKDLKAYQLSAEQPPVIPPEPELDTTGMWLRNLAEEETVSEPEPVSTQDETGIWLKDSEQIAEHVAPVRDLSGVESIEAESPVEQLPEQGLPEIRPAAAVEGLGRSEQERDDAFAWLEALAAKQGATEGLLTRPEERLEKEPEWVEKVKRTTGQLGEQMPPEGIPSLIEEPAPTEPELLPVEPPVASVEELGKSEQERDDSFAWLEALAAKQGVSEGLLTTPEERLEEAPEWIRQAKDLKAVSEEPMVSFEQEVQPPAETLPLKETLIEPPAMEAVGGVEELGKSEQERDDSFAWLEALAAKQGAREGLLTKPEERPEEEPDWVKQAKDVSIPPIIEETPLSFEQEIQPPALEPVSAAEEAVGWLRGLDDQETTSGSDDTAMWFNKLDETEAVPSQPEQVGDLPAWLQSLDQEVVSAAGPAIPAEETLAQPEASRTESEFEELPSWLSELEEEEKKTPSFARSDDLPDWLRDETGESVVEPHKIEPTRAHDWHPVDETVEAPSSVTPPKPEPAAMQPKLKPASPPKEKKRKAKPVSPPPAMPYKEPLTIKGTGMLTMPVDPVLASARNELSRSNIPGALDVYGKLIKKGRFLDEVIFDLREALYRYPVEVSIWQSLGDAYMRANRLQDALDAYTKAEELLR